MPEYRAIRPRSYVSATHTPEPLPSCTVYEIENTPVNTGILDMQGVPLYRMPEARPIGFVGSQRRQK